jgi:hypothetical protein
MYDVNLAHVDYAIGDHIGALFQMPQSARNYQYRGRMSIVQIIYVLWPFLDVATTVWQEWYVFQNNYYKDPENSATIHTRHSMAPSNWMKAIVSDMSRGYQFYSTFWNFRYPPVFSVANNCLNYVDYDTYSTVTHLGFHEWLWPCVVVRGPKAFYVLLELITRTYGTDRPVPMAFINELSGLFLRWQPVANRM